MRSHSLRSDPDPCTGIDSHSSLLSHFKSSHESSSCLFRNAAASSRSLTPHFNPSICLSMLQIIVTRLKAYACSDRERRGSALTISLAKACAFDQFELCIETMFVLDSLDEERCEELRRSLRMHARMRVAARSVETQCGEKRFLRSVQ